MGYNISTTSILIHSHGRFVNVNDNKTGCYKPGHKKTLSVNKRNKLFKKCAGFIVPANMRIGFLGSVGKSTLCNNTIMEKQLIKKFKKNGNSIFHNPNGILFYEPTVLCPDVVLNFENPSNPSLWNILVKKGDDQKELGDPDIEDITNLLYRTRLEITNKDHFLSELCNGLFKKYNGNIEIVLNCCLQLGEWGTRLDTNLANDFISLFKNIKFIPDGKTPSYIHPSVLRNDPPQINTSFFYLTNPFLRTENNLPESTKTSINLIRKIGKAGKAGKGRARRSIKRTLKSHLNTVAENRRGTVSKKALSKWRYTVSKRNTSRRSKKKTDNQSWYKWISKTVSSIGW